MRSMRPLLLIVLILVLTSCTANSRSSGNPEVVDMATAITAQYRKIPPQLAKEMMDSGESLVIVDVRTSSEYAQGHIPHAILIPNETISTSTRPDLLPDPQATILVYCRSGSRSSQAARKLVSLGYVNVYDFGGINDWPYETVR
ncbi:MAG: rhodanese-like domain-containing protein [Sphaerochaetaceae bacterium]|nr:rhodanese-like domain-containing protein [Sphaerochaetaceae bacterium]